MNLATSLARTVANGPDRVAIRLDAEALTYADLDDASARVAGLLEQRGIGPGDRVAVSLPNVPGFAVVYYGVLRAGAAVVPMNPLLRPREVEYYLADSGARLIFTWHATAPAVIEGAARAGVDAVVVDPLQFPQDLQAATPVPGIVERAAEDTAVILYTSGTTGRPKGAELTHANLTDNVEVTAVDLLELSPTDVVFGGLPLFHSFGQTVTLNSAVATGATLVLLSRFDPAQTLGLLAEHKVTVFAGVPTMYSALLGVPDSQAYDVSTLRVCVSGGAAMPVEVLKQFEEHFGATILEGYGLSETSPVASFNQPHRVRKPGSIGTPVRGVQMRVLDDADAEVPQGEVGEIVIRGHNVMKGYWNKPEATAAAIDADGWFKTGDLGRVDADGYFFIVDRKKDLIIRGGYNVYPREVEEVLHEHPDVREAAVIGVPHPELGEEIAAVVALRAGSAVTAEELLAFVKEQVAAYKYPRHVWLVAELPKGATGKILKRDITIPEPVTTK